MSLHASHPRYYGSKPPRNDPWAQATDGLDGVLVNGQEIGKAHRRSVLRARARFSEGERVRSLWGEE
jgi:hypothetical protein